MSESNNNKLAVDYNDQIDLREILIVLNSGKWIVACLTISFFIIGIIYSLMLPDIYKSEALLAPVDESSSLMSGALDQYRGLAGLAGLTLPSGNASSNSKKAIEVMSSLSFFENYIIPKIFLPNLMAVRSWDDKKNTIIYDESVYRINSNTWVNNSSNSEKMIPSAQQSFEVFKGHLSIEENENGYIVLTMSHQSPSIAKQWVEIFVEEINAYYRQKDKLQSEKAVIYLNKQIANTSLSEIRAVTASILEKEIQKLTLIEANKDYVFEYIYPPSVMEKKSEPYRSLIVGSSMLFGFILAVIFVLSRFYFFADKNALKRITS